MEKKSWNFDLIKYYIAVTLLIILTVFYFITEKQRAVLEVKYEFIQQRVKELQEVNDSLKQQLEYTENMKKAAETSLGLFPDPKERVPPEFLKAARAMVLSKVPKEYQEKTYKMVLAHAKVEVPNFYKYARGTSGEYGQMQIMPYWFEKKQKGQEFNYYINIERALHVMDTFKTIGKPAVAYRYNTHTLDKGLQYQAKLARSYKHLWGQNIYFN